MNDFLKYCGKNIHVPLDLIESMHMLHHLSFAVADLARSAAFYDAALVPLGYVRLWTHEPGAGTSG
jgi:hypothetical protein